MPLSQDSRGGTLMYGRRCVSHQDAPEPLCEAAWAAPRHHVLCDLSGFKFVQSSLNWMGSPAHIWETHISGLALTDLDNDRSGHRKMWYFPTVRSLAPALSTLCCLLLSGPVILTPVCIVSSSSFISYSTVGPIEMSFRHKEHVLI